MNRQLLNYRDAAHKETLSTRLSILIRNDKLLDVNSKCRKYLGNKGDTESSMARKC